MIEPAINVYTTEEFMRRVRLVRDEADMIQIDVSDGKYGTPKNFADPVLAKKELKTEQIDVHLMVEDVNSAIHQWVSINPKRITFHVEPLLGQSSSSPNTHIDTIKQSGIQAGIAVAPDTLLDHVESFIPNVDFFLFVGVHPGKSGQQFNPRTTDRIQTLRRARPDLVIGVDGGVQKELVAPLFTAGANVIIVGSGIFSTKDPVRAFREFQYEVRRVVK